MLARSSEEKGTLTQADSDKLRGIQGRPEQRPAGFWLLARLTPPGMTWTWAATEARQAVKLATAALGPQTTVAPAHIEENAALPRLVANLQGKLAPALLGTGAVQSFIHPDLVQQAQLKPQRKGGITFMGPSREAVTTSLLVKDLPITAGTQTCRWDVSVAPLTHPLILGYDFIKQYTKQRDVQGG